MFTLWHCTEADLILQLQLANNQSQGQTLAASVYNHPVQNWQCNAVIQAGNCLCPVIFYMVSYIMFVIIILEAPLRTTLRGKKKTKQQPPHICLFVVYTFSPSPWEEKVVRVFHFGITSSCFYFCVCVYIYLYRGRRNFLSFLQC